MSFPDVVIVAGARTPFGRIMGNLAGRSAVELGTTAIRGALEKAGVSPDDVDAVIMGQVLQAGAGQNPAKQSAVAAGIPWRVPAITLNKVCLSGLVAIADAARLIRLGESASRLLGTWARPYLARLVEETGETANMALLDGDEIVYVAQVPSKHSMRMFTEVGRRVLPHSTGVGKALLAGFPPEEVRALLGRTGMPAATDKTITTPDGFLAALEDVRRLGYAMDDNEQEIGVRCLAVSVPDSPTAAAISISGPAGRVTEAATERIVPVLQQVAAELSEALANQVAGS